MLTSTKTDNKFEDVAAFISSKVEALDKLTPQDRDAWFLKPFKETNLLMVTLNKESGKKIQADALLKTFFLMIYETINIYGKKSGISFESYQAIMLDEIASTSWLAVATALKNVIITHSSLPSIKELLVEIMDCQRHIDYKVNEIDDLQLNDDDIFWIGIKKEICSFMNEKEKNDFEKAGLHYHDCIGNTVTLVVFPENLEDTKKLLESSNLRSKFWQLNCKMKDDKLPELRLEVVHKTQHSYESIFSYPENSWA